MKSQHLFHDCPLRSSSLIIVNQEKQIIVTATDETFNLLGYDPHQLIGKSIHILKPRKNKQGQILLQHENRTDRVFELCIHHDPLQTDLDLEYWLLKPTLPILPEEPMTILRLGSFGLIEHAYPTINFPQSTSELKGHPIMSFVHQSDTRLLCEKLKQCKIYDTFKIRWLNRHPKHGQLEDYNWLSFTVIHTPNPKRRYSCSASDDPQTRPICILRPISDQPMTFTSWIDQVQGWIGYYFGSGLDSIQRLFKEFHKAIDQGKTYLVEYFAHVMMQLMKIMEDVLRHLENNPSIEKTMSSKLLSPYHHVKLVKVAIDNYIWSVPLLDTFIRRTTSQEKLD